MILCGEKEVSGAEVDRSEIGGSQVSGVEVGGSKASGVEVGGSKASGVEVGGSKVRATDVDEQESRTKVLLRGVSGEKRLDPSDCNALRDRIIDRLNGTVVDRFDEQATTGFDDAVTDRQSVVSCDQSSAGASSKEEETLDPSDWHAFKMLGHRMVDDMVKHLSGLHEQPAWRPMPDSVKTALSTEPVPFEAQGDEDVYKEFVQNVLPYPNGNLHPRFWGWVQGNGIPLASLAEMMASAMNPHMAGFNQAPALVEEQVLEWLRQMLGMPETTTGVLVAGGTMANILGLAVARHVKAGFDMREVGLQGNHARMMIYSSTEVHSWLKRACQFLGLGNMSLRQIRINENYEMDLDDLRHQIHADREAGLHPICVVGTAGSINVGAIDDLEGIAKICREEDLWFHVDAAYGAFAKISPKLRHLVAGIEQVDSIGFDLHKWMYLPFEIACTLIRDGRAHKETFSMTANYLTETTRGVIAGGLPFAERGVDLTRNFKALKAWMCMKSYGINKFIRLIEQNVEQSKYLAHSISESKNLELMAPVKLNVVCFRYISPDLNPTELDALNEEILLRIQEKGIAVPSSTRLNGRLALRVANVNHRSRRSDFDTLLNAVIAEGDTILGL
jgi:aromatic-L-amino-acid/L-tryptophan decarboxylase